MKRKKPKNEPWRQGKKNVMKPEGKHQEKPCRQGKKMNVTLETRPKK
jgi:hypothetical protein